MRPRRHVLSVALGVFAGLMMIGAVALQVERWSQIDALRAPPVSQVGIWAGIGLLALVALAELMLARLPSGTRRAIAMTAVSGGATIIGAVAGGAGAESAALLFYAGIVGLVAALAAVIEAPRPVVAVVAGLLGSAAVAAAVDLLTVTVGRAFP